MAVSRDMDSSRAQRTSSPLLTSNKEIEISLPSKLPGTDHRSPLVYNFVFHKNLGNQNWGPILLVVQHVKLACIRVYSVMKIPVDFVIHIMVRLLQ